MKRSPPEDVNAYIFPSFLFVWFSQTRAVILGVMRKRKLKVEQLTAVDMATFGNLMCGFYPSEIKRLSPYNLRSVKNKWHQTEEEPLQRRIYTIQKRTETSKLVHAAQSST